MRSVTKSNKKSTIKITTVTPKRNIENDPTVRPQNSSKRPNAASPPVILFNIDCSDKWKSFLPTQSYDSSIETSPTKISDDHQSIDEAQRSKTSRHHIDFPTSDDGETF